MGTGKEREDRKRETEGKREIERDKGREEADRHRGRRQRHEEGHTDMCRVARQHRKSHLAAQPSACTSAPGPRVDDRCPRRLPQGVPSM